METLKAINDFVEKYTTKNIVELGIILIIFILFVIYVILERRRKY
jgi:hypothetical protein